MYLLYSALLAVFAIVSLPYWLWQEIRAGKYGEGLAQRFGNVPPQLRSNCRPSIWVHAVSVGEVLAVAGLVEELRRRYPDHRLVVSTTTKTGQALARKKFGEAVVFYFPLDFAFAIRPYLRLLQPELVLLAETEFWPNFLRLCHQAGARIAVVNARISDRSFPRYRRLRHLIAPLLRNVDVFLAQSELDHNRLLQIGVEGERVQVSGNLKFDIRRAEEAPVTSYLRSGLKRAKREPVIVAGSTTDGEEALVIAGFSKVRERFRHAFLVLAPRHPERWEAVARMLSASGLRFWRRAKWADAADGRLHGDVLLLDTIGELASVYSLATVAFVGGSLVARGGHNILEPAQHGCAIVVGPHTENFRDIVALFVRAGAVDVVKPEEFSQELLHLLYQTEKRQQLAEHAAQVVRGNAGATRRTLQAIDRLLQPHSSTQDFSPAGVRTPSRES